MGQINVKLSNAVEAVVIPAGQTSTPAQLQALIAPFEEFETFTYPNAFQTLDAGNKSVEIILPNDSILRIDRIPPFTYFPIQFKGVTVNETGILCLRS